ncbi:MAG: InlB B-repeat-containing protein, partial [Clostridiales Family XIII bacterium]|nr:InlB B-repeat-containing protein [Clostridiales Family XIII bacterium]
GLNPYGAVSYKARVINNNGKPASDFAVHIPIPTTSAKPADRGGATIGAKFEHDAAINSEAKEMNDVTGATILYSDQYVSDTADVSSFHPWSHFSDKKAIKTVRIAGKEIPRNTELSFVFGLTLLDKDGNPAGPDTDIANLLAPFSGKQNIYSARYGVSGDVTKTSAISEPVGVELHTGIIQGFIYNDRDRNGAYDGNVDTPRGSVPIKVFKDPNYQIPLDAKHPSVYTDQNGYFSIVNAEHDQAVYLEIVNPLAASDGLRFASDYGVARASLKKPAIPGSSLDPKDYELMIGLGEPYTVTFNVGPNAGAKPADQKVYPGDKVTRPTAPSLSGHSFDDWYTTDAYTTKFDFDAGVGGNNTSPTVELCARWTENTEEPILPEGTPNPPNPPSPPGTSNPPMPDAQPNPAAPTVNPNPQTPIARPTSPSPSASRVPPKPAGPTTRPAKPKPAKPFATSGRVAPPKPSKDTTAPEQSKKPGIADAGGALDDDAGRRGKASGDTRTGNFLTDLLNGDISFGGFTTKGTWGLLNLLMSLAAIIVAILALVRLIRRRRNADEALGGKTDRQTNNASIGIASLVAGVLTPVVWLIAENLSNPVTWISNRTLLVGAVFLVHIVLFCASGIMTGKQADPENTNDPPRTNR